MAEKYSKPALTYREQANQLAARGMSIPDLDTALRRLQHNNYYRLGAYWLPFEADHKKHLFKPGTTLEHVISLYEADRDLRLLVLDAIERIEVSVRAQWAYQMGHEFGPHAHLDPRRARDQGFWEKNHLALKDEVGRSKEVFIVHLSRKYTEELPPIWAVCEIMSFGLLSRMVKNTRSNLVRKRITGVYRIPAPLLDSWLQHLTYVRNLCAHHARLWNRELTVTPEKPRQNPADVLGAFHEDSRRIYNTLLILRYWCGSISPDCLWQTRILKLLDNPALNLRAMGFPDVWREMRIWQL